MVLIEIPRFIMIKFPSDAATLCTVARCKIVLFLGFGKSSYHSLHIIVYHGLPVMVYHGLPIMVNQFGWWVRWGGRVGVNPYGQPDHEIPPFFAPSLINLSELLKRLALDISREKESKI